MVFFALSSVGLPGLNGFIGEALCLFGIAQYEWQYRDNFAVTALAASGMLLGAWYLFTMMRRLLFGPVKEPHGHGGDLLPREWLLLAAPAIFCVVIGIYPQPILQSAQPDVDMIARIADMARERAGIEPSRALTLRP
jgi:NADH-quinone oxidoreductase subunit M